MQYRWIIHFLIIFDFFKRKKSRLEETHPLLNPQHHPKGREKWATIPSSASQITAVLDPHRGLHIETYNSGSASAFLFRRELNTFRSEAVASKASSRARIISTGWFIALFQASKAGQPWQRRMDPDRVPVNSIYFLGWLARPGVRGGGPIIRSYARTEWTQRERERGWRRNKRERGEAQNGGVILALLVFFSNEGTRKLWVSSCTTGSSAVAA